MNSLSLLLGHVPIYHLAIEEKGQRQGRPWKNKNITQTLLSWHVRLELLRRKIRVSNDQKFQSVREKKRRGKNSVHMSRSGFEGRASIFFRVMAFIAVAI